MSSHHLTHRPTHHPDDHQNGNPNVYIFDPAAYAARVIGPLDLWPTTAGSEGAEVASDDQPGEW